MADQIVSLVCKEQQVAFGGRWHAGAAVAIAALAGWSTRNQLLNEPSVSDTGQVEEIGGTGVYLLSSFVGLSAASIYLLAMLVNILVLLALMFMLSEPLQTRLAASIALASSIPVAVRAMVISVLGLVSDFDAASRAAPLPFIDPVILLSTFALFVLLRWGVGITVPKALAASLGGHLVASTLSLVG